MQEEEKPKEEEKKESIRDHDNDIIVWIGDCPITNADLDNMRSRG